MTRPPIPPTGWWGAEIADVVRPVLDLRPGPPTGAGWTDVAGLAAAGAAEERLALVRRGVRRLDVASSFLGSWIVAPAVTVAGAAWLLQRRAPELTPDTVFLRGHPSGWFDAVALAAPGVAVLAGDPLAGGTGVRVLDLGAARAHCAAGLVAVTAPLLDAVHAAGRFGRPGLWGTGVVDRLFWLATDLAARGYGSTDTLVGEVRALLAEVQPLVPVRLPQGRTVAVPRPDGVVAFPVKSACCLLYRTVPPARRVVEEYCTGCPLVPEESRVPRWSRFLDSTSS